MPNFAPKPHPQTDEYSIYGENALWHCHPIWLTESFPINGALAQILKRFPAEYHLEFISPTGA
jgi:hypothetical protein